MGGAHDVNAQCQHMVPGESSAVPSKCVSLTVDKPEVCAKEDKAGNAEIYDVPVCNVLVADKEEDVAATLLNPDPGDKEDVAATLLNHDLDDKEDVGATLLDHGTDDEKDVHAGSGFS
eukprot:6473546-Amphidinium_carterae.1